MEKLISYNKNIQYVPDSYILPPDTRPGKLVFSSCKEIPVIDLLGNIHSDRQELVQRILEACKDFGFFQLTNHGVPEELMSDALEVTKEFFELPMEDKASLYSEDPKKTCRVYTSINYAKEKVHFWRDNLRHPCHPLEDHVKEWPSNPARYKEVMGKYAVKVRELSLLLLGLIGEGLGLESGYFEGERSKDQTITNNHYPRCPDPSLTLGLPMHSDANMITLVNQDLSGLQVLKDDEWLTVEPVHNSFVVNIGHSLQIFSNGKLRSSDHRVVTNTKAARTSVGSFIHPSNEAQLSPASILFVGQNRPLYKSVTYSEFTRTFIKDTLEGNPPIKSDGDSMDLSSLAERICALS